MIVSNEPRSVRRLAAAILAKVDSRQAYADTLLDQALSSTALPERDRALLTELTYGTLRWRGTIDARLGRQLRRPLADTEVFVRNLLRVTVYQLFFLDKIPNYAAVNEAVELAKAARGAKRAGFVNGVLRNLLRHESSVDGTKNRVATGSEEQFSHPDWLAQRWISEFGPDEAYALMLANNRQAPLALRFNRLKCGRAQLRKMLGEAGVIVTDSRWSPDGIVVASTGGVDRLPGFGEGWFQVQAESAQLVAHLLAPEQNERILDACAAPGGKSCHIAELMNDNGTVIALDAAARGVTRIRANAARLGLHSIQATQADVTNALSDDLSMPYDRILVDAPCSGLGTLRAHPEIKWRRQPSDIERLSRLQMNILRAVARHLKPGGVLVYSTCTLAPEENEGVVENFLAVRKEFELQEAARYLPETARRMVHGGYFQTLPQRDDTDGFFAARMRRVD